MAEWTNPWPKTPIGDEVSMHCLACGNAAGVFVIEELMECGDWRCRSLHCGRKGLLRYQMLKAAPAGTGPEPTGQEKRDYINRQLVEMWEGDVKSTSPTLRRHGSERMAAVRAGTEPRVLVDFDSKVRQAPYR